MKSMLEITVIFCLEEPKGTIRSIHVRPLADDILYHEQYAYI